MEFKDRKEQRHVVETMDAILMPLKNYLNDDAKYCVEISMRILRDVGAEDTNEKRASDCPLKEVPTGKWISVSKRLPNDRNWYLGIFKEVDTGWINPLPFICDYVGIETKATTKGFWILRGFTDIDEPHEYYTNLECVAWQPLPKPYVVEEQQGENND